VYGEGYVRTMLANARALQCALVAAGLVVIPSTTHHLALPLADAAAAQDRLEACGILCGTIAVSGYAHPRALRIGTQLLTRRGFEPPDMAAVGQLVAEALSHSPQGQLRHDVAMLARSRRGLVFCHQ
jgi:glycine hydroxymethyltransferase